MTFIRSHRNQGRALLFGLLATLSACTSQQDEAAPPEQSALVSARTALVQTLTEELTAYGTVVAAPGAQQSPAAPFDAIVDRVLVTPGMPVDAGQTLVTLRPSPAALTMISQASSALTTAEDLLRTTRQRDSLGLSTRDEISQAGQARQDARARYDEVETWKTDGTVRARARGVVAALYASEGALLSQGTPLLDLTLEGRFEVRLGVEPEDVARIRIGQAVTVRRPGGGSDTQAHGSVRAIAHAVNPDTRLVDVMIAIDAGSKLLFGETVQGAIGVQSSDGVIVPRTAVLPHEGQYQLFVVRDGRANARFVELGVQTDSLVEVLSGVADGDSVVILGNYVLQDSMRVRTNATVPSNETNQ